MRALVIAIVLVIVLVAAARVGAEGFDHAGHAKAKPLECSKCHAPRLATGHATCFGACHGPLPTRQAPQLKDRAKVCASCHSAASLADGKFALAANTKRDFALAMGHKQHQAVACAQCHPQTKRPPHQRCTTCHDGKRGGPMTACAGCHTPAVAPPRTGFVAAEIVVSSAFSHARHAAKGGAGKQCATCHGALLASNSPQMARVTAASCAIGGCHDGKASFSPIASCTKCHKDVPTAIGFKIARPDKPYSHTKHEPRGVGECLTCHSITAGGEILIGGHSICAGCHDHAADFGRRDPQICGACHNSTEPWRALTADRSPLASSEFGASLDHKKHGKPCTSCHSLATAAAQLRAPRGHRSCTGAGCHAKATGAKPHLAKCDGCHQLGLTEQRTTQQLTAAWSVRARFDHTTHKKNKTGAAMPCVACHVDLSSPSVLSLASPPKSTCAPCHDGDTAFKLTGTTCKRCHPGVVK